MKPDQTVPVAHLCPALTELARVVRRHTPIAHPDRAKSIALIREVQDGIHQLRENEIALRESKL